jgi:signal transduction histidine kinase/CheY-like chemotaxis protein
MIRQGIERQMQAITMIPILVLSLLLGGYFTYARFAGLERAQLERARLIVHQLASASEYPVFSGSLDLLQRQVDIAHAQEDVTSVIVQDADSRYLAVAGVNRNVHGQSLLSPDAIEAVTLREDHEVLWLYQPIVTTRIELNEFDRTRSEAGSKPLGYVFIEISKTRMNQQKVRMLTVNMLLTLLIMSATLLVVSHVSRRITRPVMGMSKAIRSIGDGRLDTRIASTKVSELDVLAHGINEMAQQLQLDRSHLERRIKEATLELRVKKEEAEKANYDKSRFLAAASHDLRQPMHALGLFVGELHNRIDNPEQRKIVGKIEESVEALSGLLDSLLDISKLDAGVVMPQIKPLDLNVMLERLIKNMTPIVQRKSIRLRMHLADHAMVLSDPVLLERILLNLLGNAVRYTPQNGTILLACRKRGGDLHIEVRDNGIGIPPEEQKNIFREFVQLANNARERNKGLGLGLAIVDRLARLLHHSLSLRSEVGRGSVFTICAPCVEDAEGSQDELDTHVIEPNRQDALKGLRVLVVDDDPLVLTGTGGILSSWGCSVSIAESLQEVAEKYSQSHFDVVICDYRLPDGSGIELADRIKEHCEHHPSFVLVSGDTAPEVLKAVEERGLHLLHKPVRPAKLRSLIQFLMMKNARP